MHFSRLLLELFKNAFTKKCGLNANFRNKGSRQILPNLVNKKNVKNPLAKSGNGSCQISEKKSQGFQKRESLSSEKGEGN